MTSSLTLCILFPIKRRAVVVGKLVVLDIFFIKSRISSYVSNIRYFIFNNFDLSVTYIFFNSISFTTSISLLKSTGESTNLLTSNLFTLPLIDTLDFAKKTDLPYLISDVHKLDINE